MSQITAGPAVDPAAGPAPVRPVVRVLVAAGLLIGAWLVPVLAHLLRVDWVVLVLLVAGVAALLRVGPGVLDRLVLAGLLVSAILLGGGLLFSYWPWRLNPVAVGGLLLTALVVAGLATGRRPDLPRAWYGSDLAIIGPALFAMAELYRPLAGRGIADRLPEVAISEDRAAHFSLFDTVERIGGYGFLHPAQARLFVVPPAERVYPQGSHFLFAVVDLFARSATGAGPTVSQFNRYFLLVIAAYGCLVVAVAWAARWVAGPSLAGWRRCIVCAVVGMMVATGALPALIGAGFDSEIVGLMFLALSVAVTVRPAGSPRLQVVLVAAGGICVAYTYNLFLLFFALGAAIATVGYSDRLRPVWRFATVVAVVAGSVALLPTMVALFSGFSPGKQIQMGGTVIPMSRATVVGLVIVVLAGRLTRTGTRHPVWRIYSLYLLALAVLVAAFGAYQRLTLGRAGYYFDKALAGVFVTSLVGFGAVALFLKPAGQLGVPRLRRWAADLVPGVVAVLVAATLVGGVQWGLAGQGRESDLSSTWIGGWALGDVRSLNGEMAGRLYRRGLLGDGIPTIIIYSDRGLDNWRLSYLSAVLTGYAGRLGQTDYTLLKADLISRPGVAGDQAIATVETAIRLSPVPLRVIVVDAGLAQRLRAFAVANPDLDLSVQLVPQLLAPASG